MVKPCYCQQGELLQVLAWDPDGERPKSSSPLSINDLGSIDAKMSLIFAEADRIRECDDCCTAFTTRFAIPPVWWTQSSRRSNGHFGYEDIVVNGEWDGTVSWVRFIAKRVKPGRQAAEQKKGDQKGDQRGDQKGDQDEDPYRDYWAELDEEAIAESTTVATTSRSSKNSAGEPFDYFWTKINALSRWHASSHRIDIVLFDHPRLAHHVAEGLLLPPPLDLRDPFCIYPRILDSIVRLQDIAVWDARNLVRTVEKQRAFFSLDFPALHEVPRHVIHVFETLQVSEITIDAIRKHHDLFVMANSSSSSSSSSSHSSSSSSPSSSSLPPSPSSITNSLALHHHMLASLRLRSDSNKARIQNELSLAYNDAARIDSSAMRAISFVSLFFLPATFVSAVFSTSFFNFDANSGLWAVSPKFWLFWAVSLPLTLFSIVMWHGLPKSKQWVREHIRSLLGT